MAWEINWLFSEANLLHRPDPVPEIMAPWLPEASPQKHRAILTLKIGAAGTVCCRAEGPAFGGKHYIQDPEKVLAWTYGIIYGIFVVGLLGAMACTHTLVCFSVALLGIVRRTGVNYRRSRRMASAGVLPFHDGQLLQGGLRHRYLAGA